MRKAEKKRRWMQYGKCVFWVQWQTLRLSLEREALILFPRVIEIVTCFVTCSTSSCFQQSSRSSLCRVHSGWEGAGVNKQQEETNKRGWICAQRTRCWTVWQFHFIVWTYKAESQSARKRIFWFLMVGVGEGSALRKGRANLKVKQKFLPVQGNNFFSTCILLTLPMKHRGDTSRTVECPCSPPSSCGPQERVSPSELRLFVAPGQLHSQPQVKPIRVDTAHWSAQFLNELAHGSLSLSWVLEFLQPLLSAHSHIYCLSANQTSWYLNRGLTQKHPVLRDFIGFTLWPPDKWLS